MKIEDLHREFLNSKGVCTDSRNIVPDSIFFALKGEHFDGNIYASEAISKGCRLAIVDNDSVLPGTGIIRVNSALKTLQELAHYHRKLSGIKILAITGSNGKTTTKELIAAVLGQKYSVIYTRGNLNNHIGVPLTLLGIRDQEFGVIEMGANHAGEIALLSEIVSPDYGLITNVGKAHLEGFGSLEGVLDAKGELYQYLAGNNKTAFLNKGNKMLLGKAGSLNLRYIAYNDDKLYGRIVERYPSLQCEVFIEDIAFDITTNLVGAYNLENIITAVSVGINFEVPISRIIQAIASYEPQLQRSQLIRGKKNTIILDAYNANPTSMRESVSDFLNYTENKKMVILGDMLELGAKEEEEHKKMVEWLGEQAIDQTLLIGQAFQKTVAGGYPKMKFFPDTASCKDFLKNFNPEDYHILIKGSRKMALENLTIPLID